MNADTYLDDLTDEGVSGYARVFDQDAVLLDRPFGAVNRQPARPLGANTIFDIASIAKTFSAAAILRLSDANALALDDRLPLYFAHVPPDKHDITIRQLLTHTSGLTRYISDDDFEPMSREQAIARAFDEPLRAEPGTQEQYGEANYALLAAIIERVTAQPFAEHLRAQIIAPLGLNQTGWYGDGQLMRDNLASGFIGDERRGDPASWSPGWAHLGAGGMLSTPDDLTIWLRSIASGSFNLSENSRRALIEPVRSRWSCGWEVHDRSYGRLVLKGGSSDFGFAGAIGFLRDRDAGIVLLLNGRPPQRDGVHHEMVRALLAHFFEGRADRS